MTCHNLKAKAMHVISVHLANLCIFATIFLVKKMVKQTFNLETYIKTLRKQFESLDGLKVTLE